MAGVKERAWVCPGDAPFPHVGDPQKAVSLLHQRSLVYRSDQGQLLLVRVAGWGDGACGKPLPCWVLQHNQRRAEMTQSETLPIFARDDVRLVAAAPGA